jgi:hypothetical protein
MASSFDLQEELQALQDIGNYPIDHEHDIGSMEPAEMDGLLRRAQLLFRLTEECFELIMLIRLQRLSAP